MGSSFFERLESRIAFSSSPIPGRWDLATAFEFDVAPATPTWVNTLWGHTQVAGESQTYLPANVSAANGILSLTAEQENFNGRLYTSGMINTGGNTATGGTVPPGFSVLYGYIEARMKLVSGQGFWTGFWMLP